jgi:branched-chain amino acid transport system substrate-binding protein
MRFAASVVFTVATLISTAAQAQFTDGVVKIGVLTDMSSLYADATGPGSVTAANLAVQDFNPAAHGMKVEIVSADHQNKPDIGSNIARQWIDVDGVDVIMDVPTSSVALAVNDVVREKNKVLLVSGGGTSDLTGSKCSPNTIHWTYDTWMLAHADSGLCLWSGPRTGRGFCCSGQWWQGPWQCAPSPQHPRLLVISSPGATIQS